VIANAATEVSQAIFFAAAIIIAGFVPLFTLSGIEGHIFGPMAKTYAYAIAGGLIATFTVSPALSALLLPNRFEETETAVVRALRRVYEPVIEFALANRIAHAGLAALLAAGHAAMPPAPWAGIPAQAGGRQFVDPRHDAASISLEAATATSTGCAAHRQLSRGADRGLAARPAGRRHRRDRLLQRRILRAAEAVRQLAEGRDKEKLTAADDDAEAGFPASTSTSRSTSRTTSRRRRPG
jgi:Cu/Ag efflux pump CusA